MKSRLEIQPPNGGGSFGENPDFFQENDQTGCTTMCDNKDDLADGSCSGLGCCQTSISKEVWRVEVTLKSYENYTNVWNFNNCSYGSLVEESAFKFSPRNLSSLMNVEKLPMVVDWAIGNGTLDARNTCLDMHVKAPIPSVTNPIMVMDIAVYVRWVIKEIHTSLMDVKISMNVKIQVSVNVKSIVRTQ
ncbi:wall-associated receptor kinase 2-like [Forsythia ovata]|uniref:Wall-associated receptor kinase 2-like n=1 Tax=Forsythia ovata TaxID=205694 RepID=A0ABD1UXG7_9LAMI